MKPILSLLEDDDDDAHGDRIGGGGGDDKNGGGGGGGGGGGDGDDDKPGWNWKYALSARTRKQVAALALGTLLTTLAVDLPFSPLNAPEEGSPLENLAVLIGGHIRIALIMAIAYLLQPNLSYNARKFAGTDTGECGDAVNYVATLLGLVYAILVGSTYDDANNKQDLVQGSLYREVSNLHQVVMLGKQLNGGRDKNMVNNIYRMVRDYVQCTRENDFTPEADICSKCAYQLADMTGAVTRLASDGKHDYVDQTILQAVLASLRNAQSARADRLTGFTLNIPPNHLLRMRVGGTALVAAFLLISSGSPKFDRMLFAGLTGTYVVLDSTLRDMGQWNKTWGDFRVDDGALEDLEAEVQGLIDGKPFPTPPHQLKQELEAAKSDAGRSKKKED
eukprot:tig00020556_g11062.t1